MIVFICHVFLLLLSNDVKKITVMFGLAHPSVYYAFSHRQVV
jgi:hypothetical protein